MPLVFERDFDLGSVKLDLAVVDNHVLRHDFCYAQLAQMFSGLLDHVLGGVFPTLGAGADEFDNVISALGIDNLWLLWTMNEFPSSTRRTAGAALLRASAHSTLRYVLLSLLPFG